MISIIQNNDVYEIRFRYDPTLVDMVKQVPGRMWHNESKMWTIPKNNLGFFLNQIKGTVYENICKIDSMEHINENADIETTTNIPNIDISRIPYYVKEGAKPYKHQLDFMKYAIDKQQRGYMSGFLIADDMGLGKALSLDTKIYTPGGYKLMKDIQVGDIVFNEKGEPVEVLRTYDHEDLEMYKVTFSDGTSIKCCKDHLWQFNSQHDVNVWPLHKILNGPKYGQKTDNNQRRYSQYYIPITSPVQFNHKDIPIDPWLLGFILGDGSIPISGVSVTTSYPELVSRIESKLDSRYMLKKSPSLDIDYTIVRKPEYRIHGSSKLARNYYVQSFKNLGLAGCNSSHKFVPDCYKYNSIEVRKSVLQGLMDSDGYAAKGNHHEFCSTSKQLAEDVVWLVQSLGGICNIYKVNTKFNNKPYTSYNVTIRIADPRILYTFSNKLSRAKVRKFKPHRRFANIEYIGHEPGRCIAVSGESHLYLAEHFIVTHNTSESINLAIYNKKQYKFKHCLIICNINTSKYNWKNEVESATKGKMTGYILGARIKKDGTISYDGGSKPKIEDLRTEHMYGDKSCPKLPYFLICNVESLRAKEGRKYVFADLLIDYINSGKINMGIIDEIHKNMSPTSTQGKQILRIKKATGHNCEWIPMTGTPIVKKPTDVFLPMKLIDAHNFSSYYTWNKEFCIYGGFGGHEIIGYKNIPRVKTMLQNNMIRRLKDQVLDLPPKIYFTEYVDNTPYQAKLYESVRQATLAEAGQILKLANPMVKLLKLRQVNGSPELVDPTLKVDKNYLKHNAKMQRMLQILEDIHEAGEKVIIFSNWVEPLRMVYKILIQKYKVCCFTGTMSDEAREKNKQVFQNNPEYTILIGTIGAAGTTHTFTAASNIIFLDEPFNATDKSQAEDRAYRIGTKQSLKIYTLLSRDTVDDRVHEIVYEKAATSKYIVDGVIDFRNNPDLFYKLLGK